MMKLFKKVFEHLRKSEVERRVLLAESTTGPESSKIVEITGLGDANKENLVADVAASLAELLNQLKNDCKEDICEEEFAANEIRNFYIPQLKSENDERFNNVICLLKAIGEEKMNHANQIAEEWQEIERQWMKENKAEYVLDIVLSYIKSDKRGKHEIVWNLIDPYYEYEETRTEVSLECHYSDTEEMEILQEYIQECKGNLEGYSFRVEVDPDLDRMKIPFCNVAEVSDTRKIRGNCISSDCDTYGSAYGVKAQAMYVMYLTDIKKYAVVHASWVEM